LKEKTKQRGKKSGRKNRGQQKRVLMVTAITVCTNPCHGFPKERSATCYGAFLKRSIMKTILVPIDFSTASRKAADYAAMLAKETGAGLFLLHAYTEPVPATEAGIPLATIGLDLKKEFRVRMHAEAKRLAGEYGIAVKGEAIAGMKGTVIKQAAEEVNATLICIGRPKRKHSPLFGSTIMKAIRKTNTPVLVVPEETDTVLPKRVLLAVDFKEMLRGASVTPLLHLVKDVNASLTVLHIENAGTGLPPAEIAEKLQAGLVLSKATYVYESLENENIEAGIFEFLDRHPTDLLVMIAHRHGLVARLFGRAHTPHVAFAVNIPLLILKDEP
jgi:nucleotide-binding universal stress UspA family protein